MPSYGHQNRYQLVENFDVILHAKNQIYPLFLSWNITDIPTYTEYFEHAWSR